MQRVWGLLFGVAMIAAAGLFAVAPLVQGWWLPKNVATYGAGIDLLFYVILAVTGFFFVLTEAILVYIMLKFAGSPGRKATYVHGNHRLEVLWTVVPGVLLFLLAISQIGVWADVKYQSRMPRPVATTQQLEVTARQWEWRVRYPSVRRIQAWDEGRENPETFGSDPHIDDVHVVNEIHVWLASEEERKNNPDLGKVLVHLKTRDVLHSFFLPHLRIKQDAVPGKSIRLWFQPTDYNTVRRERGWEAGINPHTERPDYDYNWELACAEFCGTRHSLMRGRLFVHKDKKDFLAWLAYADALDKAAQPTEIAASAGK
ncbi:MAG: cytochrome c oxidase subunit II [Gemmataceae bacterium]|nr:cytochrome c oxidase subunit II [Gemmataceae bacterium]